MSWEKKLDFGMLYRELMKETRELSLHLESSVPKWKRDLLVYLLIKSKEKPCPVKTKYLRRMVSNELNRELES